MTDERSARDCGNEEASIMANQMSNAIARKHFLHDIDTNHDTGNRCCYFAEHAPAYDQSGWGFWVEENGEVTTDEESANGSMPNAKTVEACRKAAMKWLGK